MKDYKLRYQEIEQSTWFLIAGIIITVLTALALFLWTISNHQKILKYIFVDHIDYLILMIYVIIMSTLMVWAFKMNTPSSKKITRWEYLSKNYGLSPSGLAECANFRADFNPKTISTFESGDSRGLRQIQIFSDIELRGYKYWFFIYSLDDQRHIFNLTGAVNDKTSLKERFFDIEDIHGWSVNIASFDFDKYKNKELYLFLFIFDPILYGDVGAPYWGYKKFTYEGEVISSSEYNVPANSTHKNIKYFGSGLKFKKYTWQDSEQSTEVDEIVKKVFNNTYIEVTSRLKNVSIK
ncbi:MAG: hypothetical protein ACKKL6_00515 [Candidatus Komeilibacteria bacterium]